MSSKATYLALPKISNSDEFTIRGLSRGKIIKLNSKNKLISYNQIVERFAAVLKPVNLDWKNYRLHSLQSSGALLAAYNSR